LQKGQLEYNERVLTLGERGPAGAVMGEAEGDEAVETHRHLLTLGDHLSLDERVNCLS